MLVVLRFAQVREAFRQAEIESILDWLGVDKRCLGLIPVDSPFHLVDLPNMEIARSLLGRSVLLMDIYGLFAVSDSFTGLHSLVRSVDFTDYIEKPFKFRVDSYMKSFTESEQLDMINSFSYMPLKGPVRLKDPSSIIFTILYDASRARWMFAEQISIENPMRALVDKYSLKKRDYLGTTSMDAEMGLVMANIAKVGPNSLAYDPFVGTGSLLFAAAHFGAFALGSDIDGRQMRGGRADENGRGSLRSNVVQYGLHDKILGALVFDICQHPWRDDLELFDAIIADPPYGVRAGAKRIAKTRERSVPVHLRSVLYPTTAPYELDELTRDLLAFAGEHLVSGGRLVFWYPQDVKEKTFDPAPLFDHPKLTFKYSIPQPMRMILRWLLVYEKD